MAFQYAVPGTYNGRHFNPLRNELNSTGSFAISGSSGVMLNIIFAIIYKEYCNICSFCESITHYIIASISYGNNSSSVLLTSLASPFADITWPSFHELITLEAI